MATDGSQPPTERRVTTQDEYEEQVHERTWVELEDGDGWFQVREIPPLGLLRDMEDYGVLEMMGGAGDDGDVDMEKVMRDGDLNGFINDVVLPNIVQPYAYWSDVDVLFGHVSDDVEADVRARYYDQDEGDWTVADRTVADAVEQHLDGPVWDLGALSADDLMTVITGMTGQDAEDLQEQADNQFRG